MILMNKHLKQCLIILDFLSEKGDQVFTITDQHLEGIGITQQQYMHCINLMNEKGLVNLAGFQGQYSSITMSGLQYLEDNRHILSPE